ncbi:hypothetical protein [Methylomonas koyamae]|uniref:hypothetical protein n=1 Tax=Methylomonas koyamae TaxID=702114 RepID=UPI0006D073CC|nr:hypothetical protein [Methylomonas koyamae]
MDIYAQYRLNSLAGPLPAGRPAALPAQPAIFGRLAPDHPDLDGILHSLVSAGVPSRIQVPNAPPALAATLAGTPVELSVGRCDLMPELNHCSLVLHAGDIDMADAALAAGRPQLLLPVYVEQALVADQLAELGIAVRIDRPWDAAAIVQTLGRAAANATLAALAQSLALRLSQRHLKPALDLIVEEAVARCASLIKLRKLVVTAYPKGTSELPGSRAQGCVETLPSVLLGPGNPLVPFGCAGATPTTNANIA